MSAERRQLRTPVALYANEIGARNAELAFVVSLSMNGLFSHALCRPWTRVGKRAVIELSLPGEAGLLRIIAELVHENHGALFRETALRFLDMPTEERDRLGHWLICKQMELQELELAQKQQA